MSREFYQKVALMHENIKEAWDKLPPSRRHVEYRDGFDGRIYVYLYKDGEHIQTVSGDLPEKWRDGCTSRQFRLLARRMAGIDGIRIKAVEG